MEFLYDLNTSGLARHRNFGSHLWHGQKPSYEKDLKHHTQTNKYDRHSGYRNNLRNFEENILNPLGARILACPTYQDLMWSGTTGALDSYTQALHTVYNEFEYFIKHEISTKVRKEF